MSLLQVQQQVSTEELALDMGVSKETIRRDLIELEQGGRLSRIHGGAVVSPGLFMPEPSYTERTHSHREEKQRIGRTAATLMQSGQSCFIDAGSTTLALAQHLARIDHIRVLTNAVEVVSALRRNERIDVMLLGGRFESDVPATYGEQTIEEIARHRVDLAFISPVAVDARLGAMDYAWHEAAVARAMLQHSQIQVLVAHRAKVGQASRVQVCALSQVDVLVTDQRLPEALQQALTAAGVGEIRHP